MAQSKTIPGMKSGGLSPKQAFEKPGGTGRIPSNDARSPVAGASNGKGGGPTLRAAAKSLNKQSEGCC
jgi:hypothetical protein